MTVTRGTTNSNDRGSSYSRRRRREWLVETYRADVSLLQIEWSNGHVTVDQYVLTAERMEELYQEVVRATAIPTCRCYRCGCLLTVDTVTVDRIIPGCMGGTYRRDNIRPACATCNSSTGGALAGIRKRATA